MALFFISLLQVVLHTKPVWGVWGVGFFVWLVYVLFIWLVFLKSTFSSSAPLTFNILKLSFSVTFLLF